MHISKPIPGALRAVSTAIMLTVMMTACGGGNGGGGSGGSASPASPTPVTPPPPTPPPTVTSIQFGTPINSTAGAGSVNGPVFQANPGISVTGFVDVIPGASDPAASYMRVWLQVNTSGAEIAYYDWTILGWQNTAPHGSLAFQDQVLEINPVTNSSAVYRVRTFPGRGGNRIRYESTTVGQIRQLTQPFTQAVTVTAWTADGRFANATFSLEFRRVN